MSGASSIQPKHKLRRMIPMKKIYSQPELTVHGNVEALTQAIGPSPAKDFIIIGGTPITAGTDGSGDFSYPS
jgi:hypothetical protein